MALPTNDKTYYIRNENNKSWKLMKWMIGVYDRRVGFSDTFIVYRIFIGLLFFEPRVWVEEFWNSGKDEYSFSFKSCY